jgi:Ca2+-transporting ATPase
LLLYLHQQDIYNHEWVKEHERVDEIPFDSERKVMTTIHKDEAGPLIITKGAVESITAICQGICNDDEITRQVDKMTSRGLRVMAYAYNQVKELPDEISSSTIEKEMKFLGLAGLIDPPREEAKQAIQECRTAGIVPVMITGDHPSTAEYIARELEILRNENDLLVTGTAMEKMPDMELEEKIEQIKVYARVSPTQKLRIVSALQKKGHFVAMTGDGVNDAPSIKMANIGVAMGITGTDVTKEAAQMILLDDNFATIVKAVKQGRRIFENIRKFIHFIMAGNTAELVAILIAPLMGLPLPLLPVQILWINLVTDGLPALALVAEPSEKDIMLKPPRKPNANIFSDNLGKKILAMGFFMGILTLTSQVVLINEGHENWQTMIFTILCFSQLWHVLAIRSETKTLFTLGIFTNMYLIGAVLFTVGLQLLIIYVPSIGVFFHASPLTFQELLFCFLMSSLVFVVLELSKVVGRKRR